jgi:pyruvate/2-oxoglutarate/acetoin dehydrogenase E1 component
MKYFDELQRAMNWLGKKEDTIFLGQSIQFPGTAMTNTLNRGNVPESKLLEMPVNEDMQMGMTIGMSLNGLFPVSIFPRWNFLLLATNQIVNHLDKIPLQADVPYKPRLIIRTGIGSVRPLHPQYQHVGDFTDAFRMMCQNIDIIRLDEPEQIFDSYVKAYERTDGKPTIIVEWGDYYNEK